ncbi:protein PRY2-like [Branchiostoma floridae]|uniref:Protein PRY2-like n=1 Tax=Branchiostoma floridae TaxID=7739 RepID=A0A9J7L0W9_BRAFL|nr:protein PRY2-like [Branchiostoma floridae]
MELMADAMKAKNDISKRSVLQDCNGMDSCNCYFNKHRVGCASDEMKTQCPAACEQCIPAPGSCTNMLPDSTCNYFMTKGYLDISHYQYFMSCRCTKASGLCTDTQDQETTDVTDTDIQGQETTDEVQFRENCLKYHNLKRPNHNAGNLTWDEKCAEEATKAAKRQKGGRLVHTRRRYRTWGNVVHGENLAYMTRATPKAVIEYWYKEKVNYNQGCQTNPVECFRRGKRNRKFDISHFAQLVWKKTEKVGCGKEGNVIACMYGPTGNVLKTQEFRDNVDP